ncbi:Rpl14 (mitochondrion) [Ostreococcus tauri]|jgi:large subunit ribosomal protein L14|uniref:Mitochondrion, complete genome n=1 Tax=Ostreococcus tauri TaxID=70448 RepID=Q0P3I1_OSTTA|nr:Rpl14 [Ostreococcus tauri]AGR42689.1 ribosomal protein L14 [Ostreococcus tauri]AGR42732.1 ribosomal protein L14 [Ostreococcus tauri]AGR42775.1 ribosomal protein L14 [Ostreococcus tauri]AGR42818.1 ribosomal protein L14 [Ostreococcus tauri]AGR42861.1 ribosomal protein L14 [Ostreococcus tauri]|eukprot:YP_717274.1 Rpl14 (mitochondrion) [Ostreococcus tauri]
MIQVGTQLHVADNSGAKKVECIKVLNKTKQRVGGAGEFVLVSVKEINQKQTQKVKKGQIFKAVILETKFPIQRKDGSSLKFQRNTVILVSPQLSPVGTRIQSFVPYELRHKNLSKILALASASI